MGMGLRNRLARGVGYLVYTLAILVVLLWWLFPQEALQRLLVGYLNRALPGLDWRVQAVTLRLPLTLKADDLAGYAAGGEPRPLVRVDELILQPDWAGSVRTRSLRADYSLHVDKGVVAGSLQLSGRPLHITAVQGTARGLQLADCPLLAHGLGREIRGQLSGTFAGDRDQFKAEGTLVEGRLGLKRPILKHTELPFARMTMMLHGDRERVQMEQGKVESELFTGQFSGTVTMGPNNTISPGIDLRGTLQPKAKFFQGVGDTVAVQAVRVQLKDKPLPFRISGDVTEPGIHFEEFALVFQTLEKELQ